MDERNALPLRPVVYAILVTLAEAPQHGYAIMQQANRRLGRRALLGPGTLYRTLKELRDRDLIAATETPPGVDERRRYHALTPQGRQLTARETERLADLVQLARHAGLAAETGAEL